MVLYFYYKMNISRLHEYHLYVLIMTALIIIASLLYWADNIFIAFHHFIH